MTARLDRQLAILDAADRGMQALEVGGSGADRMPWFCSGCPHNTSTRVPEGSRAMAGIGCHFMSIWMDRATVGFTQMGGEGVPWVGQQPFSKDQHVFANLGDGTYYHSGSLAVRQAVTAGVNITYKILYNDAVAMTGGQQIGERPEGLSVIQIAQNMRAEGAAKITIVTDEPEKYDGARAKGLPDGIEIHHRDRLDAVQREFREIPGTTVIIYDQTCATEKRRRRKRGTMVDPAVRVVINDLVCEGCGDCSVKSNCLSVEPLETEFGRKRAINQSTCNKDYSCVNGFCPSFITVEGGQLKKKAKSQAKVSPFELGALPEPVQMQPEAGGAWGIVVAGVGGTGVITIGQLLGMAAHMEGKGIVTQDAAGLAQKGGATWSHVLIGATQDDIRTTRVGMAAADLIIGCDPIVTANKETVLRMREGRTHVALNSHGTPTAAFVKDASGRTRPSVRRRRRARCGPLGPGHVRRRRRGQPVDGRHAVRQPDAAGLRLAEGLGAAGARIAAARHGAEQRAGREQQDRLRVGPPGRARPRARRAAAGGRWRRAGDRVQEARNARIDHRAARGVLDRLPERRLCADLPRLRRQGAAGRRSQAGQDQP
jgi:indolepyruvate ferredoxin oxidoreductase